MNHDKAYNDERALILVMTYLEEPAYKPEKGLSNLGQGTMVTFQDGQYNMDLNTLLFIVG